MLRVRNLGSKKLSTSTCFNTILYAHSKRTIYTVPILTIKKKTQSSYTSCQNPLNDNTHVRRGPSLGLITQIRSHGSHQHRHGEGDEHHHVHADLVTTLQNSSKRGMRITLVGLFANIALTASKGIAGWVMNSASLLADAVHCASDLLSDFVTLYTFKMSRKPPDALYPYGYGKYETLGSLTVATFLLAGGVGIGFHSLDLLITILSGSTGVVDTVAATADTAANTATTTTTAKGGHGHHHGDILDPNAAWFAGISVIAKEWLYRATIKVGLSERSEVLIANAWHHRSDAYSSAVALVAILGSYAGIPVLDPLGGILVSGIVLKQGSGILSSSLSELMDKGIDKSEVDSITTVVNRIKEKENDMIDFHSIRGRKQGPFQHVDLIIQVDPSLPMGKAHRLEEIVQSTVKKQFPEIQQVLIYLDTSNRKRPNS
ncbi:cation efflux family-domain-containing protein [Phascolomyces articulosus]|uniref:Cation efflux family-domain-containing protein n=1 Tax=Phascolomyces articulosus TaxID=60185 RepID=A0AAD5PI77_9FUNG|nr:cation efflux family-domain-containing protein [Phascolomyces articulosus]